MDEGQIQKLMKTLDLTRQEAIELIQEDEEVDKMSTKQVNADLSAEQKKVIKKMKNAGVRTTVDAYGKKRTYERKPNDRKRDLIQKIKQLLEQDESCTEINVTNIERQIDFLHDNVNTRIVLSEPRKT